MAGYRGTSISLENLINRATDATLTQDNWQYILDVCDKISSNPEDGTKQAIRVISTKLSSRDANVILRSLSLLVSIAENCGSRMKQEIATKSFIQDNLIKKLKDNKLHKTVKYKIVEVIDQLYHEFKSDPSLKPMTDAYNKVKSEYSQYFKSSSAPSKPEKREISKVDKVKEDEELQRVLKLSLQEYEREQSVRKTYLNSKPLPETKQEQDQAQSERQPNQSPSPEAQTIATVSKVRALYDLISYEADELSFRKGDVITVIESVYRDWWRGSLPNGKIGIFPLNYVTPIVNKTPQQIQQELSEENKVLNVDQKKIDRLLAILSTSAANLTTINEDEITQLYNEIIPLRPQLGKFIDKYNIRKEELGVLNNQLNNEVKYYNELMDSSISRRANANPFENNSTPYPSAYPPAPQYTTQPPPQQQTPSYPQYPTYGSPEAPLQQQPTSVGFGNNIYHQASAPYQQAQPHQQVQPPRQGTQDLQQFSNIERFPDVSNL
ncbi:uncharacterized protein RJT21DRAFT_122779 [Scheffersomyces amazonensis]|uniref:uncharacterized protein n=1 Tax=Scheffersomyces amazonensis TaxID=1078765 RepID=UPI00315DDAEF